MTEDIKVKDKIILLIEDDKLIREVYAFTLEKAGFKVIASESGDEGYESAENYPDAKLIFLDIIMPNTSGIEILKKLKSNPKTQKIPVVLLSNLTDDKLLDEAMKLGASEYLLKAQISPAELADKAREIINFYQDNKSSV